MMKTDRNQREQQLLLTSAVGTFAMSLLGIGLGLWAGAKSIVFDGMFDAIDAGMTLISWKAARLIARGADRRFQFGYWHLEPMLAFISGTVLLFACLYAAVDGVALILEGGRAVNHEIGIGYAVFATAVSLLAYVYFRRKGCGLDSTLLRLDARSWLFGGLVSAGLCGSFVVGSLLENSGLAHYAVYVDPAILVLLAMGIAPFPVITLFQSGRQILQVAPEDLDDRVRTIASAIATKHGFVEHSSYVSEAGRAQFVEIGFVASSARTIIALAELDAIRDEIAKAMGGLTPGNWLTVHFTSDRRWI